MTVRRRVPRLVSIAAISLFITSTAAAQVPEAEALFNEGVAELDKGNVDKACDAFEASNKLEPRAGTLIRLGDCREKQQKLASAWGAYKDALTRVKDPAKRQIAMDRVAALEPKLSYLTISVADDVRVEGLAITRNGKPIDSVLWNRAVPIDGGKYKIAGRAPGHEEWSTEVTVPAESGKISVEVPKFKDLKALAPQATTTEKPDDVETEDRRPSSSMFTSRRKIAVGVAGAGVVALGVGIALGVSAKSLESDADTLCPERTNCSDPMRANDLLDRGAQRALFANISYGVAGAAVITAAVLWFTGAPKAITATSDGVAIAVRF